MELVNKVLRFFLIMITFVLAGCAGSKPLQMDTTIQSVHFLNPNIYNQASPVVITVFQLKAPAVFQQANFFALYNNPTGTLGADLFDKRDIEIRPEQKQKLNIMLSPMTNYIGVLAAFRDPDKSQWRQVVQVTPGRNVSLKINVATQSITVKAS